MTKQLRIKKVFSKAVKDQLNAKGYRYLVREPNFRFPKYDVFIFERKGNFDNDLSEILRGVSRNKTSERI